MNKNSKYTTQSVLPNLIPVDKIEARMVELQKEMETLKTQKSLQGKILSDKLNSLPAMFGVKSLEEVIDTIRELGNIKVRKVRGKVTEAVKAGILEAVKSGKLTGAEIADKFGVSTGTVQIVKTEAGLAKRRATSKVAVSAAA